MLKLSKTTSLQKIFDYDCVTLCIYCICPSIDTLALNLDIGLGYRVSQTQC